MKISDEAAEAARERVQAYLDVAPHWDELAQAWDQDAGIPRKILASDLRTLLAVPYLMPDREALVQAIEDASNPEGSDNICGRKYVENWADVFADAVLALFGSESQEEKL